MATGVVQEYYGLVEVRVIDYRVKETALPMPEPVLFEVAVIDPRFYERLLIDGRGTVVGKRKRFNGKYLVVMSELIELQYDKSRDEATRKVLRDTRSGIMSMALVHKKLILPSVFRRAHNEQTDLQKRSCCFGITGVEGPSMSFYWVKIDS